MRAVKLTDKVWWVGAIDWNIRDFHGYSTSRGSTYNAYLILADKITLIDTVKAPFKAEMMARIASVIDPKKIDYIISNHTEMDHSGCLPEVIKEVEPKKVFASKMGVLALNEHYSFDRKIIEVKEGETLSLGNKNLTFLETRMLHWPDSMMTYLTEDEILFSQDGFGMHLASNERFDDKIDKSILYTETAKYYANILTPFSPIVEKVLSKVASLKLNIKMIAPDHGPIWRKDTTSIINSYSKWARQTPTRKAVIAFDTMWQSTNLMARYINEGISSTGAESKVLPLSASHRSDVATELLDAGALIIGSPTINNQMFPTVADLLTYLKGLKFKNLVGTSFGSYGWSGEAPKLINEYLKEMGVELISEGLSVKYVPKAKDLENCFTLGKTIGEKLDQIVK